ncbi:hypothetical protein GCM10027052_30220 [Parafrigoribacterium mesophilum]|uniref:hypothetical protein n=1 Tax=Parafrigoribacterium mesophilum TaxID=433646 RepID=UPI0031FCF1C8
MEITHTSVPGAGMMHHCVTRSGEHFGVLEEPSGSRKLFIYGPLTGQDSSISDEHLATIDLDEDEADQVANMLHSRPIPDRLADLERRFTQITREEG